MEPHWTGLSHRGWTGLDPGAGGAKRRLGSPPARAAPRAIRRSVPRPRQQPPEAGPESSAAPSTSVPIVASAQPGSGRPSRRAAAAGSGWRRLALGRVGPTGTGRVPRAGGLCRQRSSRLWQPDHHQTWRQLADRLCAHARVAVREGQDVLRVNRLRRWAWGPIKSWRLLRNSVEWQIRSIRCRI